MRKSCIQIMCSFCIQNDLISEDSLVMITDSLTVSGNQGLTC